MATAPKFTATPHVGVGQVTAANTARDGSGTIVTLITGVAAGTKINELVAQATVTTTAGMVRFFLTTDGGTNKRLLDEFVVTAITVGASTAAFRLARTYENLILPDTNAIIYASTHNGEAINVFAMGADF